jgi:hypothetical protein
MNKKMKLGLIFITLIILSSPTYALSFGTYVKNNEINVLRGGNDNFEIIFYSRDENPIKFSLTLKAYPNGFTITYPESFELNTGSGEEYILIENEYVKTKTIRINVDVPSDANLGEYEILLTSSSVNPSKQPNSLGVNAEKTFLLKVNVVDQFLIIQQTSETKSKVEVESQKPEEIIKEDKEAGTVKIKEGVEDNIESIEETPPTGMLTLINNKTFFWVICIISIIFISYLIYKKNIKPKEEIHVQN